MEEGEVGYTGVPFRVGVVGVGVRGPVFVLVEGGEEAGFWVVFEVVVGVLVGGWLGSCGLKYGLRFGDGGLRGLGGDAGGGWWPGGGA